MESMGCRILDVAMIGKHSSQKPQSHHSSAAILDPPADLFKTLASQPLAVRVDGAVCWKVQEVCIFCQKS